MDNVLRGDQMSPQEQINYLADSLTDQSPSPSPLSNNFISNSFPFEEARVFIGRKKITGSARWQRQLSHYWGKKWLDNSSMRGISSMPIALTWFIGEVWSELCDHFLKCSESLSPNKSPTSVPQIECPLSSMEKQQANALATDAINKNIAHITQCTDVGRSSAFNKSIAKIKDWLIKQQTGIQIIRCITKYLLACGRLSMSAIARAMPAYQSLAHHDNHLDWDSFSEERICCTWVELRHQEIEATNLPADVALLRWKRKAKRTLCTIL